METIQKITVIKAIRMLEAAGAKFAIIDEEGATYGTLKVEAPKLRNKRAFSWKHLGLEDKFRAAKADDVMIFPIEVNEIPKYATMMHSRVAGSASSILGSGNYSSCLNKEKQQIEVLVWKNASCAP